MVGAITGIVGLGLEGETRDSLYPIGFGLAGAGLVTTIVGSINWSVGNKKTREYKIRLDDARTGFYYNPKGVGVTLAFKF